MRIEGFVSLVACMILLFVLGFGLGALTRELRVVAPATEVPPAVHGTLPPSH